VATNGKEIGNSADEYIRNQSEIERLSAIKKIKRKHVPQRTCVGCRETNSKRSLIRVVRRLEGIVIDPTGKLAGRGAYLHDRRSCWEHGLKGALAHALKTELSQQDRETLLDFMASLPAEASTPESASTPKLMT
jgi:uncharacterized protein